MNKAGLLRFLSMQQVSLHISSVYLKNIITPDIFAYLEFLEFSFKARSSKSSSEEQQQAAGLQEHPNHEVSRTQVSFFWDKKAAGVGS